MREAAGLMLSTGGKQREMSAGLRVLSPFCSALDPSAVGLPTSFEPFQQHCCRQTQQQCVSMVILNPVNLGN